LSTKQSRSLKHNVICYSYSPNSRSLHYFEEHSQHSNKRVTK